MIRINTIPVGFPAQEAKLISIRIMPFQTTDLTCGIYYELFSEKIVIGDDEVETSTTEQLTHGNLTLTEEEFEQWDNTMTYIEDLVLSKLELTKEIE